MFDVEIDEEFIVYQEGTSEGTQIKYYKDGYWYKLDNRGSEGLSEYLVSKLLTFSNLEESEYVLYEQGIINGKAGCRSRNFLKGDEELVTLYRLYMNEYGQNLAEVTSKMDTMEERIAYVTDFVWESCDIDITSYFSRVFTLDALVLNEDRHFNNLALILKGSRFAPAPLFDHGVSLLTANQSINMRLSMDENVKRVVARPFSGSFEKMRDYFGWGFVLDVRAVMDWLSTEPESFERQVLEHQLLRYQELLCQN